MNARRGFTLIELLVVLSIIAVLAALAVPIYGRVTASSRSAACLSNLRQLGVALSAYLNENDQTMPTLEAGRKSKSEDVPVIDTVLVKYAPNERVFACPADTDDLAQKSGTSYFWNLTLNGQRASNLNFLSNEAHSGIPILADKGPYHPGEENRVNLLYADGHVAKEFTFYVGN